MGKSDIIRGTTSFNRSVGSSVDLKLDLFNHSCTSFQGTESWLNRKGVHGLMKQIAVSNHCAHKRVIWVCPNGLVTIIVPAFS